MGFTTLLMVCVIIPLCLAQQSVPERRTLYYVYTALSKPVSAPGIFEFSAMGLLDDRKIDYYNSKDKVKIPQQNWMKENLPSDYWEKGTQSRRSKEQWFKVNVNILMERMMHNTSDLHVLTWRHGCEAEQMPDGTSKFVWGVDEYSYDGMDFLSFDDTSMNWVAPVVQAIPTKNKWDGVTILNQYTKGYLEKECVDWLDKFSKYEAQDLKDKLKIVPLKVRLFAKELQTSDAVRLTCMATGFYSKKIKIAILKDNRVMKEGYIHDVLPNGDGTHQIRLSVEVGRSELNAYKCEVNHITLENKIELSWSKDGELSDGDSSLLWIGVLGGVLVVLVVTIILVFIVFKKKSLNNMEHGNENKANGTDMYVKAVTVENGIIST